MAVKEVLSSYPIRVLAPLAAFLTVSILATAFSMFPELSLLGRFNSWTYGLISYFLYAAVFVLSIKSPPSSKGLAWLGVLLAVHAVAQRFNLDPFIDAAHLPFGSRAIGYIGSPVDLGALLTMLFFLGRPWQMTVVSAGIWATGSRGPILAIAFGLAALKFPTKAKWIAALSCLFFLVPAHVPKDLARKQVWLSAADTFKAHPILGAGLDTFVLTFKGERLARDRQLIGNGQDDQAHAHNDILEVACTSGVLGLIAYLWLCWSLPAAPALVALFALMKFDPVSLEVLAIAAMIAGMELKKGLDKSEGLRVR